MQPVATDRESSLWPETCHGRWMSPEYEEGLVSVIIPTYNRAHFLVEAMDSVWAQTYRPIELIVVDDGSTDNTSEVLDQWAREHSGDPQFKLRTFHQENKGAPAARNLGLIESNGEFIQFVDADDAAEPTKVARAVQVLGETGADFVCCNFAWYDESLRRLLRVQDSAAREKTLANHANGCLLNTPCPTLKRRVVVANGPWHERLRMWQDWEYMARILAGGYQGVWIPEELYRVRYHREKITGMGETFQGLESKLLACRLIRSMAERRGIADQDFRSSLGRRLARVSRQLAKLGHWSLSAEAFGEACSIMPPLLRLKHKVHRVAMRLVGCGLLDKIGAI